MEDKHYGIFNSTVFDEADEKGVITTTSCPQTFRFVDKEKNIGCILDVIEIAVDPNSGRIPPAPGADDDSFPVAVKIQYNDDISYVYIEPGDSDIQDSFDIYSITCLSPIGSKFKFTGQIKRIIKNIS